MEKSVIHKSSVDITQVVVKDLATVKAHTCRTAGTLDIQTGPMEVHLFCVRQGHLCLHASFIPHPLELSGGDAIFLAFPKSDWQVKLMHEANTEFFVVSMGVSTLHKVINPSFDQHNLDAAQQINMKDLMKLIPVSPPVMVCFDQLLHHKLQQPFKAIFEQGKFLEIFSLIMESAFGQHMDACPVMLSPSIEYKIQLVRRHIMENIDEVPDPDELALQFELPRNTLKEGYRYLYGKTIHQFHADHKLEMAMQMLSSGEMLVKEVAFKIGYQNPSHFIAAFKKKFGYTPKQFIKR